MAKSIYWAVIEPRRKKSSWETAVPLGDDLAESLIQLQDVLDKYPAYDYDVRHVEMPQPATLKEVRAAWQTPPLASEWAEIKDLERNRAIKDVALSEELTAQQVRERFPYPRYMVNVTYSSPATTAAEANAGWDSSDYFSDLVWEAREARLAAEGERGETS